MTKSEDPPMNPECSPHTKREWQTNNVQPDNIDLTDVRYQRGVILSILNDFLEVETIGQLGSWIAHVGFDVMALRYPADLPTAWIAQYRHGRGYDVERALNDLLTWPPIAEQIACQQKTSVMPGAKPHDHKKFPVNLGKLANDL